MNILFIGDIFGSAGRRLVADHLQDIVETNQIDLTIANAENSAGGFGITPEIAEDLLGQGVDVLTSGNHIWDKKEIYDYLGRQPRLLRPINYPPDVPGRGMLVFRARNGVDCAIVNLQGRVYMPATDCPFRKMDEVLAGLDPAVKVRFVDFHAEVTSEKMAMGWYLDGRVSAADRNAYTYSDRRYTHPSGRDRVPDRCRDDGALRVGDRSEEGVDLPAIPDSPTGADGARERRRGATLGHSDGRRRDGKNRHAQAPHGSRRLSATAARALLDRNGRAEALLDAGDALIEHVQDDLIARRHGIGDLDVDLPDTDQPRS